MATSSSPILDAFYAHHPVKILCDSGAESSLIKYSVAKVLGLDIHPTSHSASQADGRTKMTTCGEVFLTVTRGDMSFPIEAIVMKDLGCDLIGGAPFMEKNGIVLDMPNRTIVIHDKCFISYSSHAPKRPPLAVRRSTSCLLRAPTKLVVLPGEFIEVPSPVEFIDNSIVAIEPRSDNSKSDWIQPMLSESVNGAIRIPNLTNAAVSIKKNEHLAQIHYTVTQSDKLQVQLQPADELVTHARKCSVEPHSANISIDPDNQLSMEEKRAFATLHERYDHVFNSRIGQYNDASGPVRASINMGPVPPPAHKARLPAYNDERLKLLQEKMDELEDMGVLAKPEDLGIVVEYSSPSFLVKKPDNSERVVTAFNTIGTYARPPPSQATSIDRVMAFLAHFKFIIKTDMTKQFFQLLMNRSSLKYLGTLTPFKGLRVYTRAAMGMPGSTEHLDELMSRVLGDLLQEGAAMKIADDLYTGGNTIHELIHNWERILMRFDMNNLKLSATKTVICPVTTTILGWTWSKGSIQASPHKVSALAVAKPPSTVKGLRAWLGAFKFLKSCLPKCANLLIDLEAATAGQDSAKRIQWTDMLVEAFQRAQSALKNLKSITVPRPEDQLIVTNDGAITKGIGAVLYVRRGDNTHVAGFFSAKLKPNQRKWLPCEVEALAITSAINHWAPYIVNNKHAIQILTDSRPCIQAYAKLCRGEYSHSARVSNFLSTLSRYQVSLQYIPGSSNLPADYQSRNPQECSNQACQICKFVDQCSTSTVCNLTVTDILNGHGAMPFLSPAAWKVSQQDCPTLRRVYSHLSQGTRPGHKDTHAHEVKRYLRTCTIGRHGVLVVRKEMPFTAARELIVIPQRALSGLLSALHIRLLHPKVRQMIKLFHRYFYAFNADEVIADTYKLCPQCAAVAYLPQEIEDFTTTDQPQALGTNFACDILQRARQRIFLIRDTFSSYTITRLIPDEKSATLKAALIDTTAELKSTRGCTIRVDGATAFQSLLKDQELTQQGIHLEMGRLKNRNKNPVAEKAIQELEYELKHAFPDGAPVTAPGLSIVTATLNMRVRNRGLSAKEIIFQRDGLTGEHLNLDDELLAANQHAQRKKNHASSSRSQAKKKCPSKSATVNAGDLIYIKSDGNKHSARETYIVVDTEKDFLLARKLVGTQFRSKSYKLKYSEVYPVPTSVPYNNLPPPRRTLDSSSDSDSSAANTGDHSPSTSGDSSDDSDAPIPLQAPVVPQQALPAHHDVGNLRPPPVPPDPPHSEASTDTDVDSDFTSDNDPEQRDNVGNGLIHDEDNVHDIPVDENVDNNDAASDHDIGEHVDNDKVDDEAHGHDISAGDESDHIGDVHMDNPVANGSGRPQRTPRLPQYLKSYDLRSHSSSDSD